MWILSFSFMFNGWAYFCAFFCVILCVIITVRPQVPLQYLNILEALLVQQWLPVNSVLSVVGSLPMEKGVPSSLFVNDGSFMEMFKQLQQKKDLKRQGYSFRGIWTLHSKGLAPNHLQLAHNRLHAWDKLTKTSIGSKGNGLEVWAWVGIMMTSVVPHASLRSRLVHIDLLPMLD